MKFLLSRFTKKFWPLLYLCYSSPGLIALIDLQRWQKGTHTESPTGEPSHTMIHLRHLHWVLLFPFNYNLFHGWIASIHEFLFMNFKLSTNLTSEFKVLFYLTYISIFSYLIEVSIFISKYLTTENWFDIFSNLKWKDKLDLRIYAKVTLMSIQFGLHDQGEITNL